MRSCTIIVLLLLSSSGAVAADFKLLKPIGVGGVTKEQLESFAELVRLSLTQEGKSALTDSAQVSVQPRLVKMGTGYLVALEKIENNKVVFSDSLRIAGDEEWDVAARRLSRSIIEGKKALPDEHADEITAAEATQSSQRLASRNRLVFAFGPFLSHGLGKSDETLFDYFVGMNFELQQLVPRLFLSGTTAISSNKMKSMNVGLGMAYYLNTANVSPFIGLDLAYGSVTTSADVKTNGFSLATYIGYAFMRNANVMLTVQGTWRPMLFSVNGNFAGVYGLEVGLQF